jgi:glutathione S-transferase
MPATPLKPLVLHAYRVGANPWKVAIVLEILRIPYKVKLWKFGAGPRGVKSEEFLAINPNGRVPAVEDPNTGVTSWESGAVISYILRVYDTTNKLGPGPDTTEQERVDFEKWTLFLLSGLGPMTGQVNWYRHYNEERNEDALKRFANQTYRCYDVLEKQLERATSGYVLKTGYSAVDIHFCPWVSEYNFAQLSLENYPFIRKWLDVMKEKQEVDAAYKKISDGATA